MGAGAVQARNDNDAGYRYVDGMKSSNILVCQLTPLRPCCVSALCYCLFLCLSFLCHLPATFLNFLNTADPQINLTTGDYLAVANLWNTHTQFYWLFFQVNLIGYPWFRSSTCSDRQPMTVVGTGVYRPDDFFSHPSSSVKALKETGYFTYFYEILLQKIQTCG